MSDENNELENYYVIKFENFINLVNQTDAVYHILSNLLQETTQKTDPEKWDTTALPEISAYYSVVNDLKNYLDDIINEPTEKEIELTVKYNLTDVLISVEDLAIVNSLLTEMQNHEQMLHEEYKINTIIQ
jgi:hypothetical protein